MNDELGTGTKVVILSLIYAVRGFVWSSAALGLVHFIWLVFVGRLLTPLPVTSAVIRLDLLQTLGFLVALTALEVTVLATAVYKLSQIVIEDEVQERINLRRRPRRVDRNRVDETRSWFAKATDYDGWVWCWITLANAVLFLRQGFAGVSLCVRDDGAALLAVEGWLALTCLASWLLVVLVITNSALHLYTEINRTSALQRVDASS